MPVPNQFANVTTSIPLSQLDANFNTPITLGNTAIQLGNTVSTLNNMTLANVTISSGNVTITNVSVTTANVTTANIANVTVSGTGTFAAGSNTAPSITFSGDTNTGIYSPGADQVAIATGGTKRFEVDANGNAGLGVTPSASTLPQFQVGRGVMTAVSNFTSLGENATYNSSWSYIANAAASLYQQNSGVHYWYTAASGTAGNAITFTQSLELGRGTSLALEGATTQTGTGITFPATQSASSNANTLDDYEEGDWTPVIKGGTTAGTTTYNIREGKYTKIGRQVTVWYYVDVTAATGTGALQIADLPFFSSSSASQTTGSIMTNALNWIGGTSPVSYLGVNNSYLSIFLSSDDANWQQQTVLNEAFSLIGTHTYFV